MLQTNYHGITIVHAVRNDTSKAGIAARKHYAKTDAEEPPENEHRVDRKSVV